MEQNYKIAIIGLGYVGLPLAFSFSEYYETVGFDIYDPVILVNHNNLVFNPFKLSKKYDAIIVAVAHNEFYNMGINKIRKYGAEDHVIFDVKYIFSKDETDGRL